MAVLHTRYQPLTAPCMLCQAPAPAMPYPVCAACGPAYHRAGGLLVAPPGRVPARRAREEGA
jgi:hypothetical protein